MAYKVLKPISGADGMIPAGTIVDAENWKNVASLVAGRFLVEIFPDGEVKPVKAPKAKTAKKASKPKAAKKVSKGKASGKSRKVAEPEHALAV